jgi:hypothetical protein
VFFRSQRVYIQRRFHASRIPHRPYLHNYSCGETLGLR